MWYSARWAIRWWQSRGLAVLDRSTGTLDLLIPIEQDRPENRANDIKVDGRGRVWVGTMAFDKRPETRRSSWSRGTG